MKKHILCIFCVLAMLSCLIPLSAAAEEADMVYVTISDDATFILDPSGQPMANFAVGIDELESINLSSYGLDEYIYDANQDGTPEITALHLYIYIHTIVLERDWSEVVVTGSAGSIYFAGGLFGFDDENLRYDLNGAYPNVDGWGVTADQIVLSSGDFMNIAHYSSWSFWGDSATGFHYFANQESEIVFDYTIHSDEACEVKVIRSFSDWSTGGLPAFEEELYYTVYYGTKLGEAVGTVTTDDCGNANISFPSAGQWFVWTDGGYGNENPMDIVSSPAFATVNVKEPAHTHSYNALVTAPTCVAAGYTTYTCSACGDSYTADEVAATGEHNYVDGACDICGAEEPVPEVPTDANMVFYGTPGLSLQDYIGLQIMFQNSTAKNYDSYYVEITQITPDGAVTTTTTGIPVPGYETTYTIFEQQIVSWSMTEEVTMTLYVTKDGQLYKGASFTTTIKTLAMEKIADYYKAGNMNPVRVLVDMLNYGTEVQKAFTYNADKLANADLGDYAQYGTQTTPAMEAENVVTGSGMITRDNISLQAKVEFQFMIETTTLNSYIAKATLNGDNVALDYTDAGSGYTIVRVAVGAANMRDTYTFALYDANGNAVSEVYNVSVEAYAKTKLDGEYADVIVALMKYGDAAAAI